MTKEDYEKAREHIINKREFFEEKAKILKKRIIALEILLMVLFIAVCIICIVHNKVEEIYLPPVAVPYPEKKEPVGPVNVFEYGEACTGIDASILYGIAKTESCLTPSAIGDNGKSLGMFQLNTDYKKERVKEFGEFDEFVPKEAIIIVGEIMKDNYEAFDCEKKAIASYRQGIGGVQRNGIQKVYGAYCYAEKVLQFSKEYKKIDYGFM